MDRCFRESSARSATLVSGPRCIRNSTVHPLSANADRPSLLDASHASCVAPHECEGDPRQTLIGLERSVKNS